MSGDPNRPIRLERRLARTLHFGTWAGTAIIAVGWALATFGKPAWAAAVPVAIAQAGIALFILLPVLRVLLMLVVFVRERDYRFVAIAALVLAVIIAGAALGLHMNAAPSG